MWTGQVGGGQMDCEVVGACTSKSLYLGTLGNRGGHFDKVLRRICLLL